MEKVIPPKLYKYQSATPGSHVLNNIINNKIWFSKPQFLNDPFDCAIPITITGTNKEYQDFYNDMCIHISKSEKRRAESKFITNGKLNNAFKTYVEKLELELGQKKINEFSQMGVACFSERFQSVLMWSHYAKGHKGLCLEYDTNYLPFTFKEKIHSVIYRTSYPSISLFGLRHGEYFPITPLITKSKDWEYEMEWRLIKDKGNDLIEYDPNALTAIYFGCSMLNDQKKIIASMLSKSAARLFEMKRSSKKFTLDALPYPG